MFKLEIKGHKKTRLNDKGGIKGFKVIKAVKRCSAEVGKGKVCA